MSSHLRFALIPVVLTMLACASPQAGAHATLLKSTPAPRAVMQRPPARVELWFNERLEPRFSSFEVRADDGKRIELGPVEVAGEDRKRLAATLKPLPPGRYLVRYRVLSVDGHVVQNEFVFTIRQ